MSKSQTSTREGLVRSATRTLTSQPGASLEEIAKRAGVGRATLHRHFGSRNGLIRELALAALEETDRATAQIPWDTTAVEMLRATLEAVVPLGDRYHFLSQELETLKDPDIVAATQRQLKGLGDLVAAVKQEGKLAQDVPDAWTLAALDALIYAAWSSVHEGWVARREAPGLVLRTILEGLGPRNPVSG